MTQPTEIRLWLGWRKAELAKDPEGWNTFKTRLADEFIPKTWQVMQDYGLRVYVPSVLKPSGDSGLPEEIALLGYSSQDDYKRHKTTAEGNAYSKSHGELFGFGGKTGSIGDWAELQDTPKKPLLRRATGGALDFDALQAVVHVLVLRHPQAQLLDQDQVLQALANQRGAVAVWCQPGFSAIWVAAEAALDQSQLAAPVLALAEGSQVHMFHAAGTAPKGGISQVEQAGWHFTGGEQPLREGLKTYLADWRADVPQAWRSVLQGVEPDLQAVPKHLTMRLHEIVIPRRKGHAELPLGSHLFKALDDLAPDQVRAVLLGQDPYPRASQATGRSFEQGDLRDWHTVQPTKSLRRMVQGLAEHRSGGAPHHARDAWPQVLAGIQANQPAIEAPPELFARWAGQGVLLLNLGLTLSRFDAKNTPDEAKVQPAHMALWTPIVRAVLLHLVRRPDASLLVMLWGDAAKRAFGAMGIKAAAHADRLVVVERPHPAYDGKGNEDPPFLQARDAFTQANVDLQAAQLPKIEW